MKRPTTTQLHHLTLLLQATSTTTTALNLHPLTHTLELLAIATTPAATTTRSAHTEQPDTDEETDQHNDAEHDGKNDGPAEQLDNTDEDRDMP